MDLAISHLGLSLLRRDPGGTQGLRIGHTAGAVFLLFAFVNNQGRLRAHAQFTLEFTLLVVVHHQQGAGHRRVAFEAVEHFFLSAARWAPCRVEMQTHHFARLLFGHEGLGGVGQRVQCMGRAQPRGQRQGQQGQGFVHVFREWRRMRRFINHLILLSYKAARCISEQSSPCPLD